MNGTIPAATAMIIAPVGVTKPAAGVMTTSPATIPEQNPRTLGLPRRIHSAAAQTNPAVAAQSIVVVKALDAIASAPRAEPALNPNQPTYSMPVPTMQRTMECGGIG